MRSQLLEEHEQRSLESPVAMNRRLLIKRQADVLNNAYLQHFQ